MQERTSRERHLFLSYAHRDNPILVEGQKGWVTNFQRALGSRLGQLLGDEPKIWWDRKDIGGVLATAIAEGLEGAAVLVPIVSPSYLNSEWCQGELRGFISAAEKAGGVRIGHHSRVLKVIKTPVEGSEEPDQLRDLLAYEFYRRDPDTGRIRELRLAAGSGVDPTYLEKIDDLAEDIRALIRTLEEFPEGTPPVAATLYLAECTSDLGEQRDRIRRSLLQKGYAVLPDRRLPAAGPEIRKLVKQDLARSDLSIHPIGGNYGSIPELEEISAVELQNQLAAERCADEPGFARLIWMPPGLEPADERQRDLVRRLFEVSEAQLGAEILPVTLEKLDTAIEEKLERLQAAAAAPGPPVDEELKLLYLICDGRDREEAEELRAMIFDAAAGIEVKLPLAEGDEADVRGYHKEMLRTCHGVLILCARASESWLEAKLLDLLKAPGYGREAGFAAKAICLAAPEEPWKERFRTHQAEVLRCFGPPKIERIDTFLDQFGQD